VFSTVYATKYVKYPDEHPDDVELGHIYCQYRHDRTCLNKCSFLYF